MLDNLEPEALLKAAAEAARRSYSPYSQFPVGAALLLKSGRILQGANVENASFGLTVCAERAALIAWVNAGLREKDAIVAVAVYGEKTPGHGITPCGACRQSLAEFCDEPVPVYFYSAAGEVQSIRVGDLLPARFTL